MKETLLMLEWSGRLKGDGDVLVPCCPICHGLQKESQFLKGHPVGHEEECLMLYSLHKTRPASEMGKIDYPYQKVWTDEKLLKRAKGILAKQKKRVEKIEDRKAKREGIAN